MYSSKSWSTLFTFLLACLLTFAGCDSTTNVSNSSDDNDLAAVKAKKAPDATTQDNSYTFSPPVFDISATPNGSILVAETVFPETDIPEDPGEKSTTIIKEIRQRGGIGEVAEIQTIKGSPINGLESIGRGNFFATGGALDKAVGAKVFHVSRGGTRLVGDIESFEKQFDPDAFEGLQWKIPACEENPDAGFTAGPQSNPYHLTRISGNETLVADAAGNTLYRSKSNGDLDWVAIFTPPTEDGMSSSNSEDWMVLFPLDEEANCYVQPVPTSVTLGPDGDLYVGELTGVTPANIGLDPEGATKGLSRIWRIDAGARNVVCPSEACEVAFSGFTSIIDVAFGPDGDLYVVEYDEEGWFPATTIGHSSGTINRCDLGTGDCAVVEDGITLPSAITFDKWDNLWLLESNILNPTVRTVDLP